MASPGLLEHRGHVIHESIGHLGRLESTRELVRFDLRSLGADPVEQLGAAFDALLTGGEFRIFGEFRQPKRAYEFAILALGCGGDDEFASIAALEYRAVGHDVRVFRTHALRNGIGDQVIGRLVSQRRNARFEQRGDHQRSLAGAFAFEQRE